MKILGQLPRQQLLGQHRECCALRDMGWGRRHATVDYVFTHPYWWLCLYHSQIMSEMLSRGYRLDDRWKDWRYRGKRIGMDVSEFTCGTDDMPYGSMGEEGGDVPIYPEHDDGYLSDCVENLRRKGISIDVSKTI